MNQKQANEVREQVYEDLSNILPMFDPSGEILGEVLFVGRSNEGLVFATPLPNAGYIVIRTIVKGEEFDALEAVTSFENKLAEKLAKTKK